ncbi:hypothetical protein HELRODRAFT_186943 [Helobdella robusta]|uniref:Cyclin-like domain-containing protein n=1 Tax=Helobdella robusta TaxID=6412 RepID=T1FP46_HELRO|nr:hypothetical protein HELRODRAFT_186943 [Helobdella robusta]ESO05672.1 hypothetical protein HELRODRAFT_186943 [Helobdella robusta]
MGNCCMSKEPQNSFQNESFNNNSQNVLNHHHINVQQVVSASKESINYKSSSSNLQHINDREPEESVNDPSVHPQACPIFLMRSVSDKHRKSTDHRRRKSQYDNHHHHHHHREYGRIIRKFSSCSTIFIDDSTVSQPNLKNTIRAVALAIYFHIRNRVQRDPAAFEDSQMDIFDETKYPMSKEALPEDHFRRDPEHKTIYKFIRNLFHSAQLTAECAIVTLVYLERLLTYGDMEMLPKTWKRIVLGAILLASKVWDDQAVWNVDYCQILKEITVENMNELERQFLELLQFNINVSSSVYAKYYFDLRALAEAHDLTLPFEPLSKERAIKLEVSNALKRRHSDGFASNPRLSKAIIS